MDRAPLIHTLSPRQLEAVRVTCEEGLSYKETATRMGISEQTVKNHLTDVRLKVNASATTAVCRYYGEWKERNKRLPGVAASRLDEV